MSTLSSNWTRCKWLYKNKYNREIAHHVHVQQGRSQSLSTNTAVDFINVVHETTMYNTVHSTIKYGDLSDLYNTCTISIRSVNMYMH